MKKSASMAYILSLRDPFDGIVLNTVKWTDASFNGAVLSLSGGKLICTPKVSTSNTGAEADSVSSYDLTGGLAVVTVLQTVILGGATYFYLFADANNKVFFQCDGTPQTLKAIKVVATVQTTVASVTYDSVAMKYWRIRESVGVTYWEYSADGLSWVELTHANNPITVTAVKVGLEGYDFTSESGQGAAWFSNFNIIGNEIGNVYRHIEVGNGMSRSD